MDGSRMNLLCFICSATFLSAKVLSCIFPEHLQGQTWYTKVRPTMGSRTALYFKGSVMEMQEELIKTKYILDVMEKHCFSMVDLGTFIVKYLGDSGNDVYKCIQFVNRSKSVLQLKMSKASKEPDQNSCLENNLVLEPWLIVSYSLMETEYAPCPFSGGYNMKIKDSNGFDHGCNFMDLPMRFESECHTGDGITFDFRSANCIGQMPMKQMQKSICITHWRSDGDVFSILRKDGEKSLWCLRIPARSSYSGTTMMYLYTDLVCPNKNMENEELEYFALELELIPQHSLCTDEHQNCHRLPCNGFFNTQCMKTCRKCDPNVYPTSCDFPRRYRGDWFLNDKFGVTHINISESRFHTERMGDFDCVIFPGSPSRESKMFTTVSIFNNGCRPRFTCLGFEKLNQNVLGYKISKTIVWPVEISDRDMGATICDPGLFTADVPPRRDAYRPYSDVYKPFISSIEPITAKPCRFISSYVFNATLNLIGGKTCHGLLYQDCANETRMRIEYSGCWFEPEFVDFQCLGTLEGKYWERMIVVQNTRDMYDTRCLIFSDLKPNRILMLKTGDCDQYSSMYSDAGIRQPIINFSVAMEDAHCHHFVTTHAPPEPVNDDWNSNTYKDKSEIDMVIIKHTTNESRLTLTTIPLDKYSSLQQDKPNNEEKNHIMDHDNKNSSKSPYAFLSTFGSSLLGWLFVKRSLL